MNRRTCACGTAIVCADLDGMPVWLDEHPDEGWITVDEYGNAAVDGGGPYRRHTCEADLQHADVDPTPGRRDCNSARREHAARRDIAAAEHALQTMRLTGIQRRAAELRTAHPDLSYRQLAATAGVTVHAYASAIRAVRDHAERITSTGATP